MSYSFTVRGVNKKEAKAKAADQFRTIVSNQVCHVRDQDAVLNAVDAFVDLLAEKDMDIVVGVNGALGGAWSGTDVVEINQGNVSVSVGYSPRAVAVLS